MHFHIFLPTGSHRSLYFIQNIFSKNIKIVQIFHISLVSLAGLSLLCMLLGLLTALSYSDLVKSWRGSVAVEVLGVSTRVGHRTCTRAFLHVGHTGSLRGRWAYYIRCECGDFVLSVCVM